MSKIASDLKKKGKKIKEKKGYQEAKEAAALECCLTTDKEGN